MPFVVGIEGYMKTGKTTLGKNLSKRYNASLVDMGVLYRIISSLLLKKELTCEQITHLVNNSDLESIMEDLNIKFDYLLTSFVPIPSDIYDVNASEISAKIGAVTGTKWYYKFNFIIKELIKTHNVILVGRNLLKVYPELNVHIILTSNIEKIVELTSKEQNQLSIDKVLKLVKKRNESEMLIRKFSVQNDKTKIIDVSNKDAAQVLALVSNAIEKQLKI